MRNQRSQGPMQQQGGPMNPQQILEHEENLSDKEVYPNQMHGQQQQHGQQMVNFSQHTHTIYTTKF